MANTINKIIHNSDEYELPVTSVNGETGDVVLSIPTTASDVGALPDTTKYGASIDLSINSTTYVVTAQLKDQDGNNLGTAKTIDLPLESVVVSGSYDSVNKKIILTLQNGSTIDFSVADLVAGLQSEITSTNKLNSDLVDDTNQTNKFVTSAEKTKLSNTSGTNTGDETASSIKTKLGITTLSGSNTGDETTATIKTKLGAATSSADGYLKKEDFATFNGKQDTISDLGAIRSGASAGATALQSGDNVSELTNDAGYLTSHQTLKTVNGNSLIGSGNVSVGTLTAETVVSGDSGTTYTIKKSTTAPSGADSNTITLVV